ncbi:LysR family transcriptional regulator substrate-binding protein [Streptomyces sp. NPDC059679]|uniref:LysR family transcriptional regulator substrate-binding protein n=1 Tax=Streptomyces sp. NPDC059679 TaxID=3346903 RepID=UPI003675BEE2
MRFAIPATRPRHTRRRPRLPRHGVGPPERRRRRIDRAGRPPPSGTVDAAVLIDRDPLPRGALHVATDAYEAVLRSDHPLAGEESITLADLLDDPLPATTSGCETQAKHLHSLTGHPYRPTQRIRELTTLLSMAEAGLGVAIIPSLAASMMPETLTLVLLLPRLERRLVLTGPTTRPWHPNVTAIRDLCGKHAADMSGGRAPDVTTRAPA